MERKADHQGEYEQYSSEWLAELYLKYGSVEEAIRTYDGYLPVSEASFHRKVDNLGLIKSAGRHVSFLEALHFFSEKALAPGTPLEKLYHSMPPSFQTSVASLHRIYKSIEKQTTRRNATALVMTHPADDSLVLVGEERVADIKYGKEVGDITVPMTFSKKNESSRESILRVLQQEFSTKMAISGEINGIFKFENEVEPFIYLDIVDVRVAVYKLGIPDALTDLKNCSSYKIDNHRFESIYDLAHAEGLRLGIKEAINQYTHLLAEPSEEPVVITSELNQQLLSLAQ